MINKKDFFNILEKINEHFNSITSDEFDISLTNKYKIDNIDDSYDFFCEFMSENIYISEMYNANYIITSEHIGKDLQTYEEGTRCQAAA